VASTAPIRRFPRDDYCLPQFQDEANLGREWGCDEVVRGRRRRLVWPALDHPMRSTTLVPVLVTRA
jgi:hypothetical protein